MFSGNYLFVLCLYPLQCLLRLKQFGILIFSILYFVIKNKINQLKI